MRLRVMQYCPGVSESYARDHEPRKTGPRACATPKGVWEAGGDLRHAQSEVAPCQEAK
jgi:hypothetical protein